MKLCKRCGLIKPLSDFHANKAAKDGKQYRCAACDRKRVQTYAKQHSEKIKLQWRKTHYKCNYGLSLETYLKLCSDQDNACSICGEVSATLHIDHNHTTNIIRGLLCNNCNRGLGYLKDNPTVVASAVEYLLHPPLDIPIIK